MPEPLQVRSVAARSADYRPQLIVVEESVRDSLIVSNVLSRLPSTTPLEVVKDSEDLLETSRLRSGSIAQGKRCLVLARFKGRFFKPCPAGTTKSGRRNVCCNYFVVNYASNCHMECSYCYLQSHLNFPNMVVYANHEDLLDELAGTFRAAPLSQFRVGTGELADSLALDGLTGYSRPLVEFFAGFDNAVLEFKTKSDCVDGLLDLDHGGRTVVSWSINTPRMQRLEEHKTASIENRLAAAERCVKVGYPVVFHFDPLIHYPDWEAEYQALVKEVFRRVPSQSVPWVSIGALRMNPRLKSVIRDRFPHSPLPLGELVPTEDGKLRYFKPIRGEMLSRMRSWIQAAAPATAIYSCMENEDVWRKVFRQPEIPSDIEVGDSLLQLL